MAPLIELEHVIDALNGFKRPLREGRECLKNLVFVGIKETRGSFVTVEAMCLLTSAIQDRPTAIEIVIDKSEDDVAKKINSIKCGCKSGASKEHCCKHAMAALLYLERHEEEEIEIMTCTDIEQVWGRLRDPTLRQFDPVPVKEFCHVPQKMRPFNRPVDEVSKEQEEEFRAMFLGDLPLSEAAVFESGERTSVTAADEERNMSEEVGNSSLLGALTTVLSNGSYLLLKLAELTRELLLASTPEAQEFYRSTVLGSAEDFISLALSTVGQDNDKWLQTRSVRIPGSTCNSLFTYSKNKNPDWNRKFEIELCSDFAGNSDTTRGLMFENDARDLYKKEYDCDVLTTGILVHPLAPWLGFSPDGLSTKNGSINCLWECKTPRFGEEVGASQILSKLSYIDKNTLKLKRKCKHYGQVQLGMLLSSQTSCHFTIYCCGPDEIFVEDIGLHQSFCSKMLETLAYVYFKRMLPWLVTKNRKSNQRVQRSLSQPSLQPGPSQASV